MKTIEWKDEYNLNIDSIDTQHKKLFIYLNELRSGIVKKEREESIRSAIQNLLDYGIEHFAFEEELLKKNSFPDFDEHQAMHNKYNEMLIDYKDKFAHGNEIMATDLILFIKNWLIKHILVEDMKYKTYFDQEGIKA